MDPVIHFACRIGLALLFAAAALHKWRDRDGFAATIAAYEILPAICIGPFVRVLPLLELSIAVGLVVVHPHPLAPVAAAVLLAIYAAAIAFNLARHRADIDCGCLGSAAKTPLSLGLLVRNAGLIIIAIIGAMAPTARNLTAIDACTIAGCVATAALMFLAADIVRTNDRHAVRLMSR